MSLETILSPSLHRVESELRLRATRWPEGGGTTAGEQQNSGG